MESDGGSTSSSPQAAVVTVANTDVITPAVCTSYMRQVASNSEDAFYLMNVQDIIEKYVYWTHMLPNVKPFYAVKCNSHPFVLRTLAALGCNFDCASKAEIKQILDMGVSATRIVFANPCKQLSHLRYAAQHNVYLMTFDNETELHKIRRNAPLASLILRIRVDARDAQCPLGAKFGASLHIAPDLIRIAVSLSLRLVGISFHVGSGCRDPEVFAEAICAAHELFELAHARYNVRMHLLDVGGGYFGYGRHELDKPAMVINASLSRYFSTSSALAQGRTGHDADCSDTDYCVQVIAEPGRYMVQSAFMLATSVIGLRESVLPDTSSAHHPAKRCFDYYINSGVYGEFNCVIYDHQICSPVVMDNQGGETYKSVVFGPTCDSFDRICDDVMLPRLMYGDWLIWHNMGAYTLSAAGTFNGFPCAKVHAILPSDICAKVSHEVFEVWLKETVNEFSISVSSINTEKCCLENA